MMTSALEAILKIKTVPQAQYGLDEQLRELRTAAIVLGLYDADDYLRRLGVN